MATWVYILCSFGNYFILFVGNSKNAALAFSKELIESTDTGAA